MGRHLQPGIRGVLQAEEFLRLLERERARADRNSHPFSLVIFDPSQVAGVSVRRLAEILRDRRRLTDDVGWMGDGRIGVILPDTPAEGARIYTERSHDALRLFQCDAPSEVFTYQGNASDDSMIMKGPPDRGSSRRSDDTAQPRQLERPSVEEPFLPFPEPATGLSRAAGMEQFLVRPLPGWKRLIDIIGSALLLLATSPIFLFAALAVKIGSPGPVIFRQKRAAPGGGSFDFYKFRTMVVNAEALKENLRPMNEAEGPVFKIRNDPRVTPVGRFLRRTSIDELPQLWNVLKGDMSLVGPRPPTLDEIPHYRPWHRKRLELTGGITGIWQVSGRAEVGFEDWMRMDMRYAQQRSPTLDIKLMARTVWAVISGRGAR
jgi:lipopolysaccharide/colanic/teichoic acid biosynthesis glycosyltransferase